jgi:hypothetical protein
MSSGAYFNPFFFSLDFLPIFDLIRYSVYNIHKSINRENSIP